MTSKEAGLSLFLAVSLLIILICFLEIIRINNKLETHVTYCIEKEFDANPSTRPTEIIGLCENM